MATLEDLKNLADDDTYIARIPFIATTSVFFAVAVSSAALRFFLRLRHNNVLHLDDYILLISLLCLITGTSFMHLGLQDFYLVTAFSANPSLTSSSLSTQMNSIAVDSLQYSDGFHCLIWTTIFAIKLAFLFFFKQFVNTMAKVGGKASIKVYWYAVLAFTLAGWVYMVTVPFVACPHRGQEAGNFSPNDRLSVLEVSTLTKRALTKCGGPEKEQLSGVHAYVGTAVDCLTDAFILSFPLIILHRVHINCRQKAAVFFLTSLSFGMIIIATIRAVKQRNPENSARDGPFQTYLTYIEACIAVTAVSVTAFRSVFSKGSNERHHGNIVLSNQRQWVPGTLTRRNSRRTQSEEQLHGAPIGEIGGLKTYIQGGAAGKSNKKSSGLTRKESVLRTREVVVEVHYEKDLEKEDWNRIASPSWMDEKWRRRSSESSDC